MKILDPIKIQGRYGKHTVVAIKVSDGVYNLKIVEDLFCRYGGFSEDKKGIEGFSFIDPSGGPFIAHGSIAQQYHPDLPSIKIKKLEERDGKIFMYLDTIDDDLDEPLGQACRLEDPECESCQ